MMQSNLTHSDLLRQYADWLDAHPDAHPESVLTTGTESPWRVLDARSQDAAEMAALAKAIGGRWTKEADGKYFYLRQEILPGVVYTLYQARERVCEAVVVGTETVEVPDPEAPKVTVERDVIEWRCPDTLLGATA